MFFSNQRILETAVSLSVGIVMQLHYSVYGLLNFHLNDLDLNDPVGSDLWASNNELAAKGISDD
jgi:hypothetical protein